MASDQQNNGLQASLVVDRDTASRLGITPQAIDDTLYDAFGQRQVSTIFTQLNQYHVVLEVDPQYQQNPDSLKSIYVKSTTGQQVPLSTFTHFEPATAPLALNHQGQFPAVTISFNLAPNASLGDAVKAIQQAEADIGLPASVQTSFEGTARAFQASLKNEPWLIIAAIVTVYIVLGVLYESYIHPITILSTLPSAGVGAHSGADAVPHGFGSGGADRHHPADRYREEERHHDDRLCAGGRAPGREGAARGDLRSLPVALPSDHDDDDGGTARWIAAGVGFGNWF